MLKLVLDPHRGFVVSLMMFSLQWLELDGCSLTVPDLMKIGNGEYRVKVTLLLC